MNIVTLAGTFKDLVDLQEYCNAQFRSLEEGTKEITRLQEKVIHLQRLLADVIPVIEPAVERIIVSDAQAVCEIEIRRLKEKAMGTALTMEETKRLDLLVKNLYIAKSKPQDLDADGATINEAQLLRIAEKDGV